MYEAKDGPVPANVYIAWPKQEYVPHMPAFNPFGSSFNHIRQLYALPFPPFAFVPCRS